MNNPTPQLSKGKKLIYLLELLLEYKSSPEYQHELRAPSHRGFYHKKIAETKAKIQAIADSLDWIRVEDRLPEDDVEEIWCWDKETWSRFILDKPNMGWKRWFNAVDYVSLWAYLPKPPVRKDDE